MDGILQTIISYVQSFSTLVTTLAVFIGGIGGASLKKRTSVANSILIDEIAKRIKTKWIEEDQNSEKAEQLYKDLEEMVCTAKSTKKIYLLMPKQIISKACVNCLKDDISFEDVQKQYEPWIKATEKIQQGRYNEIDVVVFGIVSFVIFWCEFVILQIGFGNSILYSVVLLGILYTVLHGFCPWLLKVVPFQKIKEKIGI